MSSNKRLFVIYGESGAGKTASLRDIENPEGVIYINCESGKEAPFSHGFREEIVTDPWTILDIIKEAEGDPSVHTIVIDSITFMMDMFESLYIYGQTDGRQGWADYNQFFKELMQQSIAPSSKRFVLLAHAETKFNEELGHNEIVIPIKGALKQKGLEAFFSIVVLARTMPVKKLTDKNELLNITKREAATGYKYVFQTLKTKDTVGSRIRGPIDLWRDEETYIDNNAQVVLDILDDYYQ